MEITKFQKGLMEHTISGPNRNWFGTDYNNSDSIEFEKLVEAGYATKQEAASWMGDDVIYSLTPEGKEKLSQLYCIGLSVCGGPCDESCPVIRAS